ncbi:MAG: glycosyltransferase family 2 protein [Pseudomonadota bacterium]
MDDSSAVSAIVVSYFTGPLLARSLQSLRRQTAIQEIVLVDNGNPPDAIEAAISQSSGAPVKLLSGHGNIGFAAACNKGADAAKGPLLLFLNPDAIMPDDGLKELLGISAALTPPWMVGAKLIDPDGAEQQGSRRGVLSPKTAMIEATKLYKLWADAPRFNLHTTPTPTALAPIETLSGAFFLLPKAGYLSIGGMDEDYFLHVEDVDFCRRFRAAGGKIYYEPSVEIVHFKSSSRADPLKVEAQKTESLCLYFKNHYSRPYTRVGVWFIKIGLWALYGLSTIKTILGRLMKLARLRRQKGKRAIKRARASEKHRSAR